MDWIVTKNGTEVFRSDMVGAKGAAFIKFANVIKSVSPIGGTAVIGYDTPRGFFTVAQVSY